MDATSSAPLAFFWKKQDGHHFFWGGIGMVKDMFHVRFRFGKKKCNRRDKKNKTNGTPRKTAGEIWLFGEGTSRPPLGLKENKPKHNFSPFESSPLPSVVFFFRKKKAAPCCATSAVPWFWEKTSNINKAWGGSLGGFFVLWFLTVFCVVANLDEHMLVHPENKNFKTCPPTKNRGDLPTHVSFVGEGQVRVQITPS